MMRRRRRVGIPVAALAAALVFSLPAAGPVAGRSKPDKTGPDETRAVKGLKPATAFATVKDEAARSIALFVEAGKVIEHPRCANCHSSSKRPRQGDKQRPHRPRVAGGKDGKGVGANRCGNCHFSEADSKPEVPKAAKWALAPAGAGFRKKTLGDICRQIRNPETNGGMDLAELVGHMRTDGLIEWSWNPGGNRTPAPGAHRVFADLIAAWAATGARCPD